MYVIQNKNNNMYFKSKITKDMLHCVIDIKEARKIVSKITTRDIVKSFNKPDNYEIVKVNKKGRVIA